MKNNDYGVKFEDLPDFFLIPVTEKELLEEWKETIEAQIASHKRIIESTKVTIADYEKSLRFEHSDGAERYYSEKIKSEKEHIKYFTRQIAKDEIRLKLLGGIKL